MSRSPLLARRYLTALTALLLHGCSGAPPLPPQDASPKRSTPSTPPAPKSLREDSVSAKPAPSHSSPETKSPLAPPTSPSQDSPEPDPLRHRALHPTQLAGQLSSLGHDPKALLPLDELPITQKFETMKLLTESLGVECTHCHVSTTDYQADTRNKRIARNMWNRWVVGHALPSGPLFCDSCHQGSAKILQREDKRSLKTFMNTQFGRLHPTDNANATALVCKDCHGQPMQPRIFEKLWGIE